MTMASSAASAQQRQADVFGGIGRFFEELGNAFSGSSRRTVSFDTKYAPNSIIVSTRQRALYFVTQRGRALRYPVGVGRQGFQWSGVSHISRKAKWPGWTPPAAMRKRQPYLPKYMPGGPGNPLGARALYISGTLYRIHGTSEARTIGRAVSSGCIRMLNDDVIDLYQRVPIGAKVYVYQ
ncbi:L,D-transpeptidase [Kaustia mangrovi]|uniref:L,D-transpeptidase n=2 Tax=Kaustia mangrovi TaxID=2593653 RepID=A0A7S8HE78_9HYPH|nr:L,D-transpeptidase [Kaustia mangrovi]